MRGKFDSETIAQQAYYKETAASYDDMHVDAEGHDEHFFALSWLSAAIEYFGITSILDVGAGTGRTVDFLKRRNANLKIVGIEPVAALREVGYQKGLSPDDLIAGDATNLEFADGDFDLVSEFGVLHHIRDHGKAVKEMLRVAKRAVFISDSNNFGQGSLASRLMKQALNMFGLWPLANLVKTKGKGYTISEGDGLAYSYSLFNDYSLVRAACRSVHITNTLDGGINPYRTASHACMLGIK